MFYYTAKKKKTTHFLQKTKIFRIFCQMEDLLSDFGASVKIGSIKGVRTNEASLITFSDGSAVSATIKSPLKSRLACR